MFAHPLLSTLFYAANATASTEPNEPDEHYRVDITLTEHDGCYPCDGYLPPTTPPPPEKPKGLTYDSTYFSMGAAPAVLLHSTGFHPALRYDLELGLSFEHKKTALTVGLDGQLMQYFGRKRPGGGADVVLTGSHGHFYSRVGLGVVAGVPRGADLSDSRPAVGGVVGIGLQGGEDDFLGRVGIDYDIRFDDTYAINHTVLLSVRFVWGV